MSNSVFFLDLLEQYTLQEIADLMQVSEITVKRRVYELYKGLRLPSRRFLGIIRTKPYGLCDATSYYKLPIAKRLDMRIDSIERTAHLLDARTLIRLLEEDKTTLVIEPDGSLERLWSDLDLVSLP